MLQKIGRIQPIESVIRAERRIDLIPIIVNAAPDIRSPQSIQFVRRQIPVFEPFPKIVGTGLTTAAISLRFIVDLPRDHAPMIRVSIDHLGDDPIRIAPEGFRGDAPVPANARIRPLSVSSDLQSVGVILIHPERRAVGRRTEDDIDAVIGEKLDDLIQPCKIELTLPGFQ